MTFVTHPSISNIIILLDKVISWDNHPVFVFLIPWNRGAVSKDLITTQLDSISQESIGGTWERAS